MNLTNILRPDLRINKMKIDLTIGTWQDNPGCPINITLVSTSDGIDTRTLRAVSHSRIIDSIEVDTQTANKLS